MIRKLLFLLIPFLLFSQIIIQPLKYPGGGGGVSDSTFYWACENDDNITSGAIPGYNAGGDNVPTLVGSISISVAQSVSGDSSIAGDGTTSDQYTFDVTSAVCSDDSGSIELKFYIDTWTAADNIFSIWSTATNRYLGVFLSGTDELDIKWRDDANNRTVTTDGANIAEDTWKTLRIVWDVDATPELEIWVDAYNLESSPTIGTQPSNWTTLDIGGAAVILGFIDDIKIWPYKRAW